MDVLVAAFGGPAVGVEIGIARHAGEGFLQPAGHVLHHAADAGVEGFLAGDLGHLGDMGKDVAEGDGAAGAVGVEVLQQEGIVAFGLEVVDGCQLVVDGADEIAPVVGEEALEFVQIPAVEAEGAIHQGGDGHGEAAAVTLEVFKPAVIQEEGHAHAAVGFEVLGQVATIRA